MSVEHIDLQFNSYERALRELPYLERVNFEVILFNESPDQIAKQAHRLTAADAFANLERLPGEYRGSTCMGKALTYVELIIEFLPPPVILDISGDGEANCEGRDGIPDSLNRLAAQGVRINTLVVNEGHEIYGDLSPVTEYQSLTRNGGFTIVADSFADFEQAIFEKLTMELAQLNE